MLYDQEGQHKVSDHHQEGGRGISKNRIVSPSISSLVQGHRATIKDVEYCWSL